MARHSNGWIKVWRASILGDIGASYVRQGLFDALVAFANLQPSTVAWNGKPRKIERGDLVTSLKELAALGGVDVKTVSKHLNYLKLRDTITLEKCSTGTFIRINNFEQYQGQDAEGSIQDPRGMDHGMDDDVHAAWIYNEELKNIRIKELKNNISVVQNCTSLVPQSKSPKDTFSAKSFKDFEWLLSAKAKSNLAALYPEVEFLKREFLKMDTWLEANPKKNKKTKRGWVNFVNNWLESGWPKYQASIPSNKASTTVAKAEMENRIAELFGEVSSAS